jgi:hypothetical protein
MFNAHYFDILAFLTFFSLHVSKTELTRMHKVQENDVLLCHGIILFRECREFVFTIKLLFLHIKCCFYKSDICLFIHSFIKIFSLQIQTIFGYISNQPAFLDNSVSEGLIPHDIWIRDEKIQRLSSNVMEKYFLVRLSNQRPTGLQVLCSSYWAKLADYDLIKIIPWCILI